MNARYHTAGSRKQLRRNIRNVLGTSSMEAPGAAQAVRAAFALQDLMDLATSGELLVQVYDQTGQPLTLSRALARVRGE